MGAIVIVQDAKGVNIREFQNALVPSRTWMLDAIGNAEVQIPRTDVKATEGYLLGLIRRVKIEADNGVGAWTGIIIGKEWTPTHLVLSLEDLGASFHNKRIENGVGFAEGQTAGQIVRAIVENVTEHHAGVNIGIGRPLDYTGLTYSAHAQTEYDWGWLWSDALVKLDQLALEWDGGHWWVDANAKAHYTRKRGNPDSPVVLEEGVHIVGEVSYNEDYSDVINTTRAYSSRDEQRKITYDYSDARSIRAYGKHSDVLAVDLDINQAVELEPMARSHVEKMKDSYRLLDFSICNHGDVFRWIREDDVISVMIPSYGHAGLFARARVLGRTLSEPSQEMRIVLEVVELLS
jgi:hypothetical protein